MGALDNDQEPAGEAAMALWLAAKDGTDKLGQRTRTTRMKVAEKAHDFFTKSDARAAAEASIREEARQTQHEANMKQQETTRRANRKKIQDRLDEDKLEQENKDEETDMKKFEETIKSPASQMVLGKQTYFRNRHADDQHLKNARAQQHARAQEHVRAQQHARAKQEYKAQVLQNHQALAQQEYQERGFSQRASADTDFARALRQGRNQHALPDWDDNQHELQAALRENKALKLQIARGSR